MFEHPNDMPLATQRLPVPLERYYVVRDIEGDLRHLAIVCRQCGRRWRILRPSEISAENRGYLVDHALLDRDLPRRLPTGDYRRRR